MRVPLKSASKVQFQAIWSCCSLCKVCSLFPCGRHL